MSGVAHKTDGQDQQEVAMNKEPKQGSYVDRPLRDVLNEATPADWEQAWKERDEDQQEP